MTNYVLVIAHPDDESMFFLPTLYNLIRSSTSKDQFHLICLSNGNYGGLGRIREVELKRASRMISPRLSVRVILNPHLQDGPNESWDSKIINKVLEKEFQNLVGDVIVITFDQGGVSYHSNHIDTFKGVISFFNEYGQKEHVSCHLWLLETISNPVRKYVLVFETIFIIMKRLVIFFGITNFKDEYDGSKLSFFMFQPFFTWRVMKTHQSQFVWYRRLSILFSCYSYWNHVKVYPYEKGNWKKDSERLLDLKMSE